MTRNFIKVIPVLLGMILVSSAAYSDEVREAIEAQNKALGAAVAAGDGTAAGNLYTEDGIAIPPGGEVVKGREAIAAFWQGAIDGGMKTLTLTSLEVESAGDLACEVGEAKVVMADGVEASSRYVVVWKRVKGTWHLHRDIWNSGPPPATD